MHLSLGTRLAQPPATSYCLNTATICMLTAGVMHTNWLKSKASTFYGDAGLQLCLGEAQLSPVPYLDSEPNLLWNIQQLIREVVPLELHKSQAIYLLTTLQQDVHTSIHPKIELDQSYGRVGVGTPALLKQINFVKQTNNYYGMSIRCSASLEYKERKWLSNFIP